jgi:hypothetical protein
MKWKFILSIIVLAIVAIFVVILISQTIITCKRPQPIPKDKAAFIGHWSSRSGFQIDIDSSGIADVTLIHDENNPDFENLFIGVNDEYAKGMLFGFEGDTAVYVLQEHVKYKSLRIVKSPYMDGDTCKMILNGVMLIKQK